MDDETKSGGTTERRAWLVAGRVQGVGFRAATRRRVQELELDGMAENLPDGRVRVVAIGLPAALDALADWLARGSAAARVDAVLAIDVSFDAGGRAGR